MAAELADHLARETEEGVARGLRAEEARRRAEELFGRRSVIEEEMRDARGAQWAEQLRQDARYAARMFARQPGYTAMALVTMTLAIGSTTAVFSLVDATLLRPVPFPGAERIFEAEGPGMRGPLDVLRREAKLAVYGGHTGIRAFNAQGSAWPERWKGAEVTAEFFEVLGVRPMLGRVFAREEKAVVVLSHAFWRERFEGRREVLNETLRLDERPYRVIGVMPAGFAFPEGGAGFWVPLRMDARNVGEFWGAGGLAAIARVRDGASPAQAQAELRTWLPRIRAMFPWRMPDAWGAEGRLTPLGEALVAGSRTRHWLLFGVVALLWAAAVVNLASLAASQAARRAAEFDMRVSLGASRARIARQLLTEGLLLALGGGFLGIVLAPVQLAALRALLPAETPRLAEAAIDGRVLAFALVITLGAGVVSGLWPAWRPRAGRRSWLVVAEAAFACVLLCGAGLMLRSWMALAETDPGFQTGALVTAELSPSRARMALPRLVELEREVRAKLAAYPGVTSVGAMNMLPLTPDISAMTVAIEDHPRPPQEPQVTLWHAVMTPETPAALGLRLLRGRALTAEDHAKAAPVALISRATAERFWPGQDPVGRRWRPVWMKEWVTIVGVVNDVKFFGMRGAPDWVEGAVWVPLAQAMAPPPSLALVMRVEGEASAFERQLPALVAETCKECAVSKIARAETLLAEATRWPRATAMLTGGFTLLALAMAAAGLFGVVSHAVVRRAREFGIRLALGAQRSGIAWLVLRASLGETLVGALIGLALAAGLARFVRSLLFGVEAQDPVSFGLAPVVLVLVAAAACAWPVWRASTTDAARALRE